MQISHSAIVCANDGDGCDDELRDGRAVSGLKSNFCMTLAFEVIKLNSFVQLVTNLNERHFLSFSRNMSLS